MTTEKNKDCSAIPRRGSIDYTQVNHPSHYQSNGKECIEVMLEEFGEVAVYNFCICNAFKYKFRAGKKEGNSKEQDLAKAKWYEDYAKKIYEEYNH